MFWNLGLDMVINEICLFFSFRRLPLWGRRGFNFYVASLSCEGLELGSRTLFKSF